MSVSLNDLKNVHKLQVSSYQKIISKRAKVNANEIAGAFEDTIDTKLLEDMYSQKDARKMMGVVLTAVKDQVTNEYNQYAYRSALFMQQLYKAAEAKEANLKIDLKELDSDVMLDGLDKLFIETKTPQLGHGGKLTSLGHGGVDVTLVQQSKDVDAQVQDANTKFDSVQNQAKSEMKTNMDLKTQIKLLKAQAAAAAMDAQNAKAGNDKAQQEQIEELKRTIAAEQNGDTLQALKDDLEQTKAELAGSIAQSSQFKTLKKMIQDKNKQVKALREELKTYE